MSLARLGGRETSTQRGIRSDIDLCREKLILGQAQGLWDDTGLGPLKLARQCGWAAGRSICKTLELSKHQPA